jgi:cytochrome o ubiquinol oxidase subunit I
VGFCMSFIPMYILGFMGATRRLDHYDASTGWQPFYVLMLIGGIIICIGVALQIVQIIASFIQKRRLRDVTGDPWDGRTLEWSTASPPQHYNFTTIPAVTARDEFWEMKQRGLPGPAYENIRTPYNTAAGIYIAILAFLAGFGFTWEITWLVVVSLVGIIVVFVKRGFRESSEYTITAEEVKHEEAERRKKEQAEKPSRFDPDGDMGLWEFIKIAFKFVLDVLKGKLWRAR